MGYSYLLPQIMNMLSLHDDIRIEHIEKDHWIGYPRAQQALEKLNHLFAHPKRTRMPNLLIVSPTNNGKTMLIQKFFGDKFPLRAKGEIDEEDVSLEAPIINMQMPSSPDIKRFYLALLEKLNPCHGRCHSTFSSFEPEVYKSLKLFNVKMLIIDEIIMCLQERIGNR